MKNNDDLQYMPMMRGKIAYTDDEFKKTNIKNHGVKKGTVKWNYKKIVTTMILTGSVFAVAVGAVEMFKIINGSPKEPIGIETQVEVPEVIFTPIEKEPTKRVVVDYLVKSGDTLDGIIYKYTDSATEKDYYKDYVTYYNNIDSDDILRMGQVITLVGVPEEYADELNTGYNESYDKNDEISVQLNDAVKEMLESTGEDYAKGSSVDTIMNELEVYNSTTNSKTRSYLARTMLTQIENVRDYGDPDTYSINEGKSRK